MSEAFKAAWQKQEKAKADLNAAKASYEEARRKAKIIALQDAGYFARRVLTTEIPFGILADDCDVHENGRAYLITGLAYKKDGKLSTRRRVIYSSDTITSVEDQ